jgi:steroid delta-isomerase-like uncharacterized protein
MSRDDIVALFNRRDAAWQRRDAAGLAATHAEGAVTESPTSGRLEGRQRIRDVYDHWLTAFPDLVFTTTDLIVEGNRVAQFIHVTGTQEGQFGGIPPTKRRIQFDGALLFTVDESGHIIHERRLYDVTTVLAQLGAMKMKPTD